MTLTFVSVKCEMVEYITDISIHLCLVHPGYNHTNDMFSLLRFDLMESIMNRIKGIKPPRLDFVERIHRDSQGAKANCTYIASCPEDDYCIELVETRDGGVIWL